ncbi:MAG TPA: pyridoxamine 5'-phosphate oxidase [Thermoanaerobaculia bacterium]|jgi:pyridoxamine 5'-phosphate oxidase|nr:pyridoxamine 5'-phosphate oxidase [Thermoanaerobaculia bacterium]
MIAPTMSLADRRRDYTALGLTEADAGDDPLDLFRRWFAQALEVDPDDANAMTLATADEAGRPSARIVLLKGCDEWGLAFFTNYDSRKGRELAQNPYAALTFFWPALDRQVRIEGQVERTSREESEAYYRSRPRGSRIGAWASAQSQPIGGREELERAVAALETRFATEEIPCPQFWGGFRLIPNVWELWQGRPNRLHDRLRYTRNPAGGWQRERLSP